MKRRRGERGQAASEYVALVMLVAVVLALAAGITSGGVGGQVLAGLQRGICRVALTPCPRPQPPQADLEPCPLERSVRGEELAVTIMVVRLGTSGTLTAVRSSDGRVTVSLAHGNRVGADTGLGARVRLGRRSLGGALTTSTSVSWTSGRAWTFADERTARRFAEAFARKATIGGQLLDGVRSRCSVLCDALGWRPHAPLPPPDEVFAEAGPAASLRASLGADATLVADASALLGRRLRRDGRRTWYLRLGADATAALALPAQLTAGLGGDAVLAYELDADDRPLALRLSSAGELRGRAAVEQVLGTARATQAAGAGVVVELDATLDLRDRANRRAAVSLLQSLTDPHAPALLPSRARELGRQIARRAQVDRRVFSAIRTASGIGAGVARGPTFDAGVERTTDGLRLLGAETRLPGLPFLPRDDCRAS